MKKNVFDLIFSDIYLISVDILLSKIKNKDNFCKNDYEVLQILLNDYIRMKEEKIYERKKHK